MDRILRVLLHLVQVKILAGVYSSLPNIHQVGSRAHTVLWPDSKIPVVLVDSEHISTGLRLNGLVMKHLWGHKLLQWQMVQCRTISAFSTSVWSSRTKTRQVDSLLGQSNIHVCVFGA